MAIDSQWGSVRLLLPFSNDLLDAKLHTVTAYGGVGLSSAAGNPFGAGNALLLDGTDDYLSFVDSADYTLGASDFTIEAWIRFTSHAVAMIVIAQRDTASSNHSFTVSYEPSGTSLRFGYTTNGTTPVYVDRTWSPSDGVWYHIAVIRTTTIIRLKVDGTQIGADYTIGASTIYDSSSPVRIGATNTTPSGFFAGYIGPVRLTAAARTITAAPSAAFPRPTISGTVYDGVGAFASKTVYVRDRNTGLTVCGAVSNAGTGQYTAYPNDFGEYIVECFDEIADPITDETLFNIVSMNTPVGARPNVYYADTHGVNFTFGGNSSADTALTPYAGISTRAFGGAGDYMQANSSVFALGLADFSIEFWYRPINGGHNGQAWSRVMQIGPNATNGSLFFWLTNLDNPSFLECSFRDATAYQSVGITSATVSNNVWHFVQLRRVAGTFLLYLDGTLQSTVSAASHNISATLLSIGANTTGSESFYGNVGPVRISRGTTRASIVVPSSTGLRPRLDGGSGENALIYDRVIPG